ncbi:hypothetical protein MMC22_001901 [Lobaria immixta]|nr:hypothetical protein [Lobaria immixta]
MSLPPEVEANFITIIDSILAASDLNTISEKRIRKGLQAAVQYDITPQKAPIKTLIMARFDKFIAEKNAPPQTNGHSSVAKDESSESPRPKQEISPPTSDRGHKRTSDDDELSDVPISPSPKKKRKVEHFVDADAAYAAKLQAEENSRARSTRGGASRKSTTIKKKKRNPKKKTSDKVKAEDDSDLQDSGSEAVEKKVNRSGGFHLSRPQTVKRIWAYVREHDLQDPSDKRMIRCDDAMRAVFKQEKVHMFTMNKLLGQNLYSQDE